MKTFLNVSIAYLSDSYLEEINHLIQIRIYATSRKVAVSIPNEVIGFFNSPNPFNSTMALESTNKPLTEMSSRNLLVGLRAASA
jgi:hypothetical protein